MKSIFISYSSKDIKDVNSVIAIANKNLSENIDLWIASERKNDNTPRIPTGEKWPEEIEKGIEGSSGAVLLVSKNFLEADIVRKFELPLIIEKARNNPDYKIYPILLDDCKFDEIEFIKERNFTNSPSTNLKALHGRRYNLEVEKLILDINRDFGKKSIREQHSKSLFLITTLSIAGILLAIIPRLNTPQLEVIEEEIKNSIIDELGVGDCFNVNSLQINNLVSGEEVYYTFNKGNFSRQDNVKADIGPVINPYLNLDDKLDCSNAHSGQIVSKQLIYRTEESKLLFPGGYLGVVLDSFCYIDTEDGCKGVLVSDIVPSSPADKSGIKKGSVILAINGLPTFSSAELMLYLSSISDDKLEEPIVLIVDEDGILEQKIVTLDKNIIELDNESAIIEESYNLCRKEYWNWTPFALSLGSQEYISEYDFYPIPILNKDEIYENSFVIYCAMYLLNTNIEKWDNLGIENLLKTWDGNIIEKFQNQFSRKNNREVFYEFEDFYTIKPFEDIAVGDCTLFDENSIEQKITDQLIPFYSDCSTYTSTMVILSDLSFSISQENLILENDEFQNFLYRECRNSYLEFRFNPEISSAIFSDYYDAFTQSIDKPLFTMNYWKAKGDKLSLKCGFLSKDIRYDSGIPEVVGFKAFDDLLNQESQTENLTLGFEYCPENYFTGDGYYVGNNFKPFAGERLNTLVLLPKWDKGEYPLESISLQIPRYGDSKFSVEILPYLNGEDFNIKAYSNAIYEYAVGFSIEDHTYLQDYDVGVIPSIISIDEDYEGPLEFMIRASDTDGGSAWASCTTNIIKNPKGEMVTSYGKSAEISDNSFGGSAQYDTELKENFSELNFPKITYLNIHGDTDNLYIDFDINDFIPPKFIFVDLLVCEFPNEPDCFRVHQDFKTTSFYKQRIHFLNQEKDYSLSTSSGGEGWKLNEEGLVLEYRNVPLSFDPCYKIGYDWLNDSKTNPIYEFNFDCVNDNVEKIAVILDSISYEVYLGPDTWCTITYHGFRFDKFKEDQPKNQSITISGCLDSEYFENVPLNEKGGLIGNRYILNYNYQEITNLDLYFGAPFYFIYP